MAKIEIYETEKDVRREALQRKMQRGNMLSFLGFDGAIIFGGGGLFSVIFDKIGLTEKIERLDLFKKSKKPVIPEVEKALDGAYKTTLFSLGGVLLVLGIAGACIARSAKKQLAQLGKEEQQQVIVPDNLSDAALSMIPIRPVEVQKLHHAPAADLKTHTQRLLDAVLTPSEKSL